MKYYYRIWLALAVVFVLGCASSSKRDAKERPGETLSSIKQAINFSDEIDDSSSSGDGSIAVPKSVKDALIPGYTLSNDSLFSSEAERFDITVNRMPARSFFMSLIKDTPVNLVVHPQVKGYVSLSLKNVTIEEVLDVTRDMYGYEYEKTRSGYLIMAARLQSRIFKLNYLNVARKGESNTRITSGQVGFTKSQNINNDQGGAQGDPFGNDSNKSKETSVSTFASSNISSKTKADFWFDLSQTIHTIIGDGPGRSVITSPQSGLVVVRAMTGELREVQAFLDAAELSMHRQVILEAKIIEVSLNEHHQTGVNWAALKDGSSRTTLGQQIQITDGQSEVYDSAGALITGGLFGSSDFSGFGSLFALRSVSDDFEILIRLLNQQGDVNVLSSPRVSTVNNQKAVIKVGTDEFFVTEVSSTRVSDVGSTTTTPSIRLTPFFSGIALDVTPQIDENDEVILHIHPAISEVVDQTKEFTVGGYLQSLPLAHSTVRETDSIVRAKNGQVIAIGGLMQEVTNEKNSGIPGLSKIPILGRLFKQKKKETSRIELVILLKPIVVDVDDKSWSDNINQFSQRLKQISH